LAERVPHLPQPVGVEIVVLGLPGLLRQHRQRTTLQPDPKLALERRPRLGHLPRPRRQHLTQALGHAVDLEVTAPVAGPRPDRPAGGHERVGDLGAKQRPTLQGGVVTKPLPRIRRHQPPISAYDADHEVMDVQLRRRRPVPPRPPSRHMQRRRDRRADSRLTDPDPIRPATVNDRLVPRHVLHCALGRRDQRLLDLLAIVLIAHSPQHRHRLRNRHRHLHMRHAGHLLDHGPALVVEKRLAVLVARLTLQRPRTAQLLAGPDVLSLKRRDQIVTLDRLPAAHAKLRHRGIGAQPQRRGPFGAALDTLLGELVVAAGERLRRGLQLQAVVAGAGGVGAVADLDHNFRQRQHAVCSSLRSGLIGRRVWRLARTESV
jgi:hypothetical protein